MARTLASPHQAAPSSTSDDYLALWRCDEATSGTNLTDALSGSRTLTQSGSPGVLDPLFGTASSAPSAGARDFNGSSQYAYRAASDSDHTFFQAGAFGAAMWVRPDTLPGAGQVVLEYGEWNTGPSTTLNTQFQVRITSAGTLQVLWDYGTSPSTETIVSTATIAAGEVHHIGAAVGPDPDHHDRLRCRIYLDGACIFSAANLHYPDGGSAARWILGASWRAGSGSGTPGQHFDGKIDDVVIARWTPSHEWFRMLYARGVCDFLERCGEDGTQTADLRQEVYARVLVEVGESAFAALADYKVNLTDLDMAAINGIDFVQGVEWSEGVDDADGHGRVQLLARHGELNLSPFVSAYTYGGNPLAGLFSQRRRVKIETANVPMGTTRSGVGPHWRLVFDGWALSADVAADQVTLNLAGKLAPLQAAWIEPARDNGDRTYGSGGGQAVQTAMQNVIDEADPARFEILRIDDDGGSNTVTIQVLDVTGPNGRGRPHPFITGDAAEVDGTANYDGLWTAAAGTNAQALVTSEATGGGVAEELNTGTVTAVPALSYLGGKPTIWVPTSPSWNIYTRNEPPTKSVAQLLEDWADEIGWRCVYRWDDVRTEYRLKLYDPRAVYGSRVYGADNVYPPERLAVHHDDQRTVGMLEYASEANLDPTGERQIYAVAAKASTQLRADGRYYFHISAGDRSLLTASSEAQDALDTVLQDLQESSADMELPIPYDPCVELHDQVQVSNEENEVIQMPSSFGGQSFDPVYGLVAEISHRISGREVRTRLTARKLGGSAPSVSISRARRHVERMAQAGTGQGRGRAPVTASLGAPTLADLGPVNGQELVAVGWAMPAGDGQRAWTRTEIHMSTASSTFTPTSGTLYAVQDGTAALIPHALTGTVYVRIVHRDEMGNRSAASTAASFTP